MNDVSHSTAPPTTPLVSSPVSSPPVSPSTSMSQLQAWVAALAADVAALQDRANLAEARADVAEGIAEDQDHRLTALEGRADVDRELIHELHEAGVLNARQVATLEDSLISARRIGAAVGIVMARLQVGEDGAFAVLRKASNDRNVKLRQLADHVVETGDISTLRPRQRRTVGEPS